MAVRTQVVCVKGQDLGSGCWGVSRALAPTITKEALMYLPVSSASLSSSDDSSDSCSLSLLTSSSCLSWTLLKSSVREKSGVSLPFEGGVSAQQPCGIATPVLIA